MQFVVRQMNHLKGSTQMSFFETGVASKLPEEYKKFFKEWRCEQPEPVHYIPEEGKWKRDPETGQVSRIFNLPIKGFYAKELQEVFTGGETIIQGLQKRKPPHKRGMSHRIPHFWVPHILKTVIYSEILDKYMTVLATNRFLDQIHKFHGLDSYLLQSKACDLGSIITLKLKRHLLFALQDKKLPYDEEKNSVIYDKYKSYLIPPNELEWYGLTIGEAIKKYKELEALNAQNSIIPYKHIYRQQLIEILKNPPPDDEEKALSEESKGLWSKIKGKVTG